MLAVEKTQNSLFDGTYFLRNPGCEKILRGLEEGWANVFKKKVLPYLPVDLLKPFYCPDNGRPSKNPYTMLGLAVIQEKDDLTDRQVLNALRYDKSYH
jgi:hypothetical protein